MQAWQRPTLPCLKTKYHRREEFSLPSSRWDRVRASCHSHQAGKYQQILLHLCSASVAGGTLRSLRLSNQLVRAAVAASRHCLELSVNIRHQEGLSLVSCSKDNVFGKADWPPSYLLESQADRCQRPAHEGLQTNPSNLTTVYELNC